MATNKQRISAAAALATAIAIPAEGLRRVAYYDPPGILTVCWGHTGSDIVKNKVYSLNECKKLLEPDMLKAIEEVDQCVPNLPINVLGAFSDAVFNSGSKIACNKNKSTAARYLWQGKLIEACNELPKWNKSNIGGIMIVLPGLTKRRLQEQQLCLTGELK